MSRSRGSDRTAAPPRRAGRAPRSSRARATEDRLLATRLTARNASSATQFCGSAIVSVPDRRQKEEIEGEHRRRPMSSPATHSGDVAATTRTISRKLSATVVALVTSSQRAVHDRERPPRPPATDSARATIAAHRRPRLPPAQTSQRRLSRAACQLIRASSRARPTRCRDGGRRARPPSPRPTHNS